MKHKLFALLVCICSSAAQAETSKDDHGFEKHTTCGPEHTSDDKTSETAFDPSCWVRLFEDYGGKRRAVLYSPEHPRQFSRIMHVDPDSKIVVDFALGLEKQNDLGLNQMSVKATLARDNKVVPLEVVGYSEIGVSEEEQASQRAPAQC